MPGQVLTGIHCIISHVATCSGVGSAITDDFDWALLLLSQSPAEFVTERCVPGNMSVPGNDTMLASCSIRETPLQEIRLRNHGSGNDGPVHVLAGQKLLLNQDRWATTGQKGGERASERATYPFTPVLSIRP